MQKFKTLYTFKAPKKEMVKESDTIVNDAGESITTTKNVVKDVDYEYCLMKPTRHLTDEGDLFYNVTVSKGLTAGLLSQALLARRVNDDGGVLSEKEKENWGRMYAQLVLKQEPIQKLSLKQGNRTPEEQLEYETLLEDTANLTRAMQEFELRRQSIFDVTAETRARTRSIIWWLLFLLYRKNAKGEWVEFFEGKDLEDKQFAYDDLDDEEVYKTEEERNHNALVVSHAAQAVTLWFYKRAFKQEEFEDAFKVEEAPEVAPEVSPEPTPETSAPVATES